MYQLFEAGGHDLVLKTNIKRWEYVLHGGRPELYPQDRKALLTLLKFKDERIQKGQKRMEAEQRIKEKMNAMKGGSR